MLYFNQPNAFREIPFSRGLQSFLIFAEESIFPYFQTVSCKNPATLKINIYISQIGTCRSSEKVPKQRKFCSYMRTTALSKWIKFGQLQRARNLVSQGGTFLQLFTLTPTPCNLFTCKYGSETESGRVSNSNTCQQGVTR